MDADGVAGDEAAGGEDACGADETDDDTTTVGVAEHMPYANCRNRVELWVVRQQSGGRVAQ